MNWTFLPQLAVSALVALAIHAAPAHAQASRTWVSGTGNDANPCSRTAPCQTFAGAISKTAAGCEISVLDAGGFGTVTINKALTINGEGALASVLTSGGSAIIVNAGASDKVILRNLQLNGQSGANSGVQVISGNVTIDKCFIYGFTTGFFGGMGVLVNAAGTTLVDIRNTDISYVSNGVWVQTSSSFAVVNLDNVRINNVSTGVLAASNGAAVSVNRSHVANASNAAIYTLTGTGIINVTDTHLSNNAVAVNAVASGSTIRLNNVSLYDNNTNLFTGAGATIATANNNKAAGAGGAPVTNGTITSF